MSGSVQPAPLAELRAGVSAVAAQLYGRSGAGGYGITHQAFEACLLSIALKYLPAEASRQECEEFLKTIRVEDVVLSRACALGNDRAWQHFMARFRELLYDAALGIAREASQAKDLADSLYGDLYGTQKRDGRRVSKLESYMGRGSLEGWLRTVLAQEYINRYRTQKRLVSLDEEEEDGVQFAAPDPPPAPSSDSRVDAAVDAALRALDAESRTILAAYYLDGRKLAEIGRMLGFHEATASRKLERITRNLRKTIRDSLIKQGFSKRQADEAFEIDVRDLSVNVRQGLACSPDAQETGTPPFQKEGSTSG